MARAWRSTTFGRSPWRRSPGSTGRTALPISTPSASSVSNWRRFSTICKTRCGRPINPWPARTATYLYACIEWVEDAFKGKELMHDIYSRLLNPTSISLANHIVDLEAGPLARDYMAWNFNSGMAAVDATLAHLVGYQDIVLSSRNVYGGTYQLLHDWYGKRGNMDVAVEWFDGFTATDFSVALNETRTRHAD